MANPYNYDNAVRMLQKYLRALSYIDTRIERVPIDGIYDTETRKALASFQRTRGLPETGIADIESWNRLKDEYDEYIEKTNRDVAINLFPKKPENYEASKGEEYAFISLIQFFLNELSVFYDFEDNIVIDGIFGDTTENAVKHFQAASMLPVTGRVDLRTWNRLLEDFSNYSPF